MLNNSPKKKIRLTRLGKWLIFLAAFLLFSAQNTGNNLLYLVCSCVVSSIFFAFVDILWSSRGFKAELLYPRIALPNQKFDIVCKIAKNDYSSRYYFRFEDSWIESLSKGKNGYLKKNVILNNLGKYIFKDFAVMKPSMLQVFYFQYVFPDFVIYVENESGNYGSINKLNPVDLENKTIGVGREGDFYALVPYYEGEDASTINWVVSARSLEEWKVIREKEEKEEKKKKNNKGYLLKEIKDGVKEPLNCYEIKGKSYKELLKDGLNKELNTFVYRLMVVLALFTCFGIYNTGYMQGLINWIALVFALMGIKGRSLGKQYFKYVHIVCLGVGIYILLKNFSSNAPVRIVLLLEFSILILALQYLIMSNIKSLLHALTLIFMIILGIAAMNINSGYPFIFLIFIIITSMLLTFFRVNIVSSDSIIKNRFAINPKGVLGTIVLIILFITLWIPFFYLIPRRSSYGIASNLSEARSKGYNNNSMNLKNSGLLEDNLTVVMRVIPNDEKTLSPSIIRRLVGKKLRGGSFSEYENGEWRKRRRGMFVRDLRNSSGELLLDNKFNDYKNLHSFDIVLENSETSTVFVPYQTKMIYYKYPFIGTEVDGSMFFVDRISNTNKRYTVSLLVDDPEYQDAFEEDYEPYEYDYRTAPYFSLNGTTDKIQFEANILMENKVGTKEKIEAVMNYLKKECNYSLEQPELLVGEEPVEKFLFGRMPGTCQHYSTAMVMLLRCMGIPCRVVNGYLMNEWNEVGGFFTVRQSHAHAWVEVYFPKSGWISFDPTPSDNEQKTSEFKQFIDKIVEVYEGYWFNYVYSFDENVQILVKRNIISSVFKWCKQVLSSPVFIFTILSILFIFIIFRNYIIALYFYMRKTSGWIPYNYILWENQLKIKRNSNETLAEFHNRLFKDNIIDETAKKILSEVEDFIDELAFKSNADKPGINKKIKILLSSIKI
ncbi:MAG: transglutaminase domain-containing protein [Candidatus Riflebacteria bacterium]|nr:transglutaminase domain-containing protein [Candidatus Riflebacteria bacterium]